MGHRLQQFLPFGRIIDLGEFLRQIQVIPADDAILDEPFAGFGHLVVFLLRLFRHQMLTYLTSKGLTDAQIQLISGHESKKSLEVYQHLSLESFDKAYQDAVQSVGI